MIVDFHTHTFPDKIAAGTVEKLQGASHTRPFTDGTVGALRASMESAGVDYSVVLPVATNPRQVSRVNDVSAALNERAAETGVLSFGCMHPDFPDWKAELARVAELGLRGIKLHPVYQGVDFDDPRYLRILDRAGETGLAVLVHAGLDVGFPGMEQAVPEKIARAVRAVRPPVLILAHMGGWRRWETVEELLPESGAYLDTSFSLGALVPNGDGYYQTPEELELLEETRFVRLARVFGTERVLFGTDSPWGGQKEELRKFRALPFTAAEQAAALGGNAQRLLRLPDRKRIDREIKNPPEI